MMKETIGWKQVRCSKCGGLHSEAIERNVIEEPKNLSAFIDRPCKCKDEGMGEPND
jgi:hypothetical protein